MTKCQQFNLFFWQASVFTILESIKLTHSSFILTTFQSHIIVKGTYKFANRILNTRNMQIEPSEQREWKEREILLFSKIPALQLYQMKLSSNISICIVLKLLIVYTEPLTIGFSKPKYHHCIYEDSRWKCSEFLPQFPFQHHNFQFPTVEVRNSYQKKARSISQSIFVYGEERAPPWSELHWSPHQLSYPRFRNHLHTTPKSKTHLAPRNRNSHETPTASFRCRLNVTMTFVVGKILS